MSSVHTRQRRSDGIPIRTNRAAALIKNKNEQLGKPSSEERKPADITNTTRVRDLISRYEQKPQPTNTARDLSSPTVTTTLPSVPPPSDLPPPLPPMTASSVVHVPPPQDMPPAVPAQYARPQPVKPRAIPSAADRKTAWAATQRQKDTQRARLIGTQTARKVTKPQPDSASGSTGSATSSTEQELTVRHANTDRPAQALRPASPTPATPTFIARRPMPSPIPAKPLSPKFTETVFHATRHMQETMAASPMSSPKKGHQLSEAASTFMFESTQNTDQPVKQLQGAIGLLGVVAQELQQTNRKSKLGAALEDSWQEERIYAETHNGALDPYRTEWKKDKTFAETIPNQQSFAVFAMQSTTRMDMSLKALRELDDELVKGLSPSGMAKNRRLYEQHLREAKSTYALAQRNLTTLSTWAMHAAYIAKDPDIKVQALCLAKALDTVKAHLLVEGSHIGDLWQSLVVQSPRNVTVEAGGEGNRVTRAIGTRRKNVGGTRTLPFPDGSPKSL